MSEEVNWKRGHYKSGQIHWETPFVNGQIHGIQRCWHSNGQLMWETPLVNGQVHGIRRVWGSDGQLWSIAKFHRGQRVIDIEFDPIPDGLMMELDLITNVLSYE